MLNSSTKTDTKTVSVAINAAINAVSVNVRGVAHVLVERLDYWLFSSGPDYFRAASQSMRQRSGLIKRELVCCPVMSSRSGSGNFQTSKARALSFGMCDR